LEEGREDRTRGDNEKVEERIGKRKERRIGRREESRGDRRREVQENRRRMKRPGPTTLFKKQEVIVDVDMPVC